MEFAASFRKTFAQHIGQDRFDLWFDGVEFQIEGKRLRAIVGTSFLADRIRRDFAKQLREAANQIGIELDILDVVVRALDSSTSSVPSAPPRPSDASVPSHEPQSSFTRRKLLRAPSSAVRRRRFRRFDQFVDGDCNQLVRASVDLVSRQPGEVSPLVIHGGTGVGKTHLLEAIWCQAKVKRQSRVLYLTAEQFTSYFLEALRGNGLPAFRRKYRQADVLLIDDIQFFAGKQATLVELTYTIDELSQQNRQLVMSADRPPAQLSSSLGREVANRLCGGLVCGMKPIDVATMETISKRWAAEREMSMDAAVHSAIAAKMRGDARQLSGILHRLQAMSLASGRPITVRMALEAIHELVPTQSRIIRLKDVSRSVCDVFGLEADSLQRQARSRSVSKPRMLAMWFARRHTSAGLHEISRFFGRRSHSSAVTAHHAVDEWISAGTTLDINGQPCDVRDIVSQIESQLRAG